jgi:hypothetical protein
MGAIGLDFSAQLGAELLQACPHSRIGARRFARLRVAKLHAETHQELSLLVHERSSTGGLGIGHHVAAHGGGASLGGTL